MFYLYVGDKNKTQCEHRIVITGGHKEEGTVDKEEEKLGVEYVKSLLLYDFCFVSYKNKFKMENDPNQHFPKDTQRINKCIENISVFLIIREM